MFAWYVSHFSFFSLFLDSALWTSLEHIVFTSEQNLKKANEEMENLKKKLTDKDSLIKLHMDKLSKAELKNTKLKEERNNAKKENKKLKIKLKQAMTELKEAKDGAVDLEKANSKVTIKEYKKSFELQEFLNTYGMGLL